MTKNRNHPTLRIYVGKHCLSCDETVRLAEGAKARFGNLNVELIDLDAEGSVNVDNVFSVPTYVLNGRTLSLGNPSSDQFFKQLSEALG